MVHKTSEHPSRASDVPTRLGEWWQFRGDRTLTGRAQGLQGRLTAPAVRWRQFCGERETWLAVTLEQAGPERAHSPSKVALPEADLNTAQADALAAAWGLGGPWYPLGAGGTLQAIPSDIHYKLGHFTSDAWEKLEFESAFDKSGGTVSGAQAEPTYGRLLRYEGGAWRQVWQSAPVPILFNPNVIAEDFDHDGRPEVAITPWYDLHVLDATTGQFKDKATFKPPECQSGRAYGWLGAFDLDACGKDEFIIIADFENHCEVLGWKDGHLQRLWYKVVESGITRKTTIMRPGTNPIQDVNGDGKLEIVLAIFNEHGDDIWHTVALDGMTGQTLLDLPGRYLTGLYDINGDGLAELFCSATQGALIPAHTQLSILSARGNQAVTLWETSGASFQTAEIQDFPLNVNSGSATKRETLLAGELGETGRRAFATRRTLDPASGEVEVTIWCADTHGHIEAAATCAGPHLELAAIRGNAPHPDPLPVGEGTDTPSLPEGEGMRTAPLPGGGAAQICPRPVGGSAKTSPLPQGEGAGVRAGLLLRARVPGDLGGVLRAQGARLRALLSRRATMPVTSVVVGRLRPDEPPTVVAQSSCETLMAFHPGPAGGSLAWRAPGRVASPRADVIMEGSVVLADVLGDGTLATIAAGTSERQGCARLVVYRADGSQLWQRDFERFPGGIPPWNVGGLTYFFAGRFTDPARCDVLVSLRRCTMHSDETYLLEGRTGETLWQRSAVLDKLGCGGGWTAVFDYDGDGLEDAFSFYPHVAYVLRGPTGELILQKMTQSIFECAAFYAKPIVADVLGTGEPQVLFASTAYVLGLLERDLRVIWAHKPVGAAVGDAPAVLQGLGDIDGDGRLELLSPGHRRSLESLAQEFRCYDAATGALKWTLPLPGSCFVGNNRGFPDSPGHAVVADVDGDGREECVVAIAHTLYCIGAAPDGRSGEVRWRLELPAALGAPSLADVAGDGRLQIVIACADGYIYGIA